ncbi:MAG: hypothetical protein SO355_06950 [Candidatus Faecousia sp.]|nr:hypothetical protein [Candidatus Faecousia sp.]
MKEIWRTIRKNLQLSLSDMDKTCTRTNRELLYGAVACTAVGMVLGLMFSPKKTTTIGSHNGNNNAGSASLAASEAEEDEEEE